MQLLDHVRLMMRYNQRMNRQVLDAAGRLEPVRVRENRGAFFGSVLGTLNHLMVADLIWLRRFFPAFPHFQALRGLEAFPLPQALDQILHENLAPLREAREGLDTILIDWARDDLREEDFARNLTYANMKGVVSTRDFGELLMHLLNHQTHHRGQASTLLFQLGQDVGVTDFLLDIPDRRAQAEA